MANSDILLLEAIKGLGSEGDTVTVALVTHVISYFHAN